MKAIGCVFLLVLSSCVHGMDDHDHGQQPQAQNVAQAQPVAQAPPGQQGVTDFSFKCNNEVTGTVTPDACQAFNQCCKSNCPHGAGDTRCTATGTTLPGTQVCNCNPNGASSIIPCVGILVAMVALLQYFA